MHNSVSVIITCYNLEEYIGQAIESVLNQDYLGAVEILVIDDCSIDRSAEIIKSYGDVCYLRTEDNLGVLMATVCGLENTLGELVFFLDGDDLWEPSKLSALVKRFMTDPKLAFVTHDLKYIDRNGTDLHRSTRPSEVMASVPLSLEDSMTRNGVLLNSDYVWLGSAYAVHRTLGNLKEFCRFAKTLPDPFNTYQDWPLAFWVACQTSVTFGYVPLKLFRYRLHGKNHSGDATSVPKAIRNVRRVLNTTQAMIAVLSLFKAECIVIKVMNRKLSFCSYLDNLYNNKKLRSTQGFLVSIPYLLTSPISFFKELIRFVGIQFLGLKLFIYIARVRESLWGT